MRKVFQSMLLLLAFTLCSVSAQATILKCVANKHNCWKKNRGTGEIYRDECFYKFDSIEFNFAERQVTKIYNNPEFELGVTSVSNSTPKEFATGFIHTNFVEKWGSTVASFRWPKGGAGVPEVNLQFLSYDGFPQFSVAECGCNSMSCDLLGNCNEWNEMFRLELKDGVGLKK